jgi:dTDP-4-dehydrorhamnose 3,5-epimerase-like enzyme
MANLLELIPFRDDRGSLTVIEKILPFSIKRVFYIYGADAQVRGGHRHRKNQQALICLHGKCTIFTDDGKVKKSFELDDPNKCLILQPGDWHTMQNFEDEAVLLVLASEFYDEKDYIKEAYDSV